MAKKILILETSVTLQKLFTTTLEGDDYSIQFANNGKEAVYSLFEFQPDIFLANCDIQEPRSFEIVRLVRSMKCFKELTIGMYANFPTPLDEYFAYDCGANSFVRLDAKTLVLSVDELASLYSKKIDKIALSQIKKHLDDTFLFVNASNLLHINSYKNSIYQRLISLVDNIESIEDMVRDFLLLIAEVCEVPVAGMYIVENDGPHGYYVCSENLGEKERSDFLSVCAADFDKDRSDYSAAKVTPKLLETKAELNRFYSTKVQLSSYESENLKSSDEMNYYGTVHIVSEGNITSEKQDFFEFCVKSAGAIFDKAIIVKKRIYFEKRIRRAFSRFVPEQIIDSLVMQSDDTDERVGVGETRAVAILFSDIRSFTNISEKNKPDVLVAFLNRYFSTMVEIIKKHGGTIDKFIGDAIMAEFGTPVSYEDNCKRAVSAAYEMREVLPSIDTGDLILPDGMEFNIGIGIHYGDVIVGSIGSKDKTDYSVIGDNVNLASRLEGLTKTYGSQILVSESVRENAGEDSFFFRHIDDVRVKGKKNAVPIYAVDRSEEEFPADYKDAYTKGMELYKQGIWNLAKDYFARALSILKDDKASELMLSRCEEFIKNPPENWDGAIAFLTK
ncbi:adenylate/guanylate cyclase domain-containing protein [Treponema sp.]|uniref:adenylate/guanylate cyclase domain-containing protein n=1 Tax=Treponema sp. TaxID=166 RepID=UPI0038903A86